MGYIKGEARTQGTLFPASFDELIGAESMVRVIDAFVNGLDVHELGFDKATVAATGRPPYDPKDLLKLYVYGYSNRVRSSRRLERETYCNMEVMWLLDRLTPDFKTIADFRRCNAEAIVGACRAFVLFCREQALYGGQRVAIDGSKFEAVASRKQVWTPKRLARLLTVIDRDIDSYLKRLDEQDSEAEEQLEASAPDIKQVLEVLRGRKEELQALAKRFDDTGDKQHVTTEPDAKLMRMAHGNHKVAYNVQTAVDDKHHLIVDFAVTNEGNDHGQLEPMALAAKEALQVDELTVVADTGYQNGKQAEHCEAAGITPVVPTQKVVNPEGKEFFTRAEFAYDPETDSYRCPAGETLRRIRTDKQQEKYLYGTNACPSCPMRAQCTKAQKRTISRSFYAEALERMNQRAIDNPELPRLRSAVVEHPYGTIKLFMNDARFLVRGKLKASAEMALGVLSYNMKRAMRVMTVPVLLAALRT